MDIEQPAFVMGHKTRRQDAHETRHYHQGGLIGIHGICQSGIKCCTISKGLMVQHSCRDSLRCGKIKAFGIRFVADHGCHAGTQHIDPAFALGRAHDGGHVGAAARNQYDNIFHDYPIMTTRYLTPIEARCLGTLMEKARTVPDSYPLSLNTLVIGCNQKTSRDPIMEVTDEQAREAIDALKKLSLAFEGSSSRVPRYEHNFSRAYGTTEAQSVLLGLLMLRGPQTSAELRTNGERWYKFADAHAVDAVLDELQLRGDDGGARYCIKLPRAPGAREQRWAHQLCGEVDVVAALAALASVPSAAEADSLLGRVTVLENDVALLRAANAQLLAALGKVCQELGIALGTELEPPRPDSAK